MKTTDQEIMEFIKEYDVKFIRLAFFDILGIQKNVSIMPCELAHVFQHGLSFDASAIKGFQEPEMSDLLLFPDSSTFSILPWRPQNGRVARMYCEIRYPDGKAYEKDARYLLKTMMKDIKKEGYDIMIGTECEFYLFQRDEEGNATNIPYDQASYCDIAPLDKAENIRREICLTLEEMGIVVESSHHEQGPGQNEIDFRYDDVGAACDNLMTFQSVVDILSLMNGLKADFSPKPIKSEAGNGLHINLSIFHDGENMFAHNQELMNSFIAGILTYSRDISIFLNSTKQSYERLGKHKAPSHICYSNSNRNSLIRIPAADGHHTRIELRSADSSCNPYIAFMLIIAAGMKGIKDTLHVEEGLQITHEKSRHLSILPTSLSEAKEIASKSTFLKEVLPEVLLHKYLLMKN